VLEVVILHIFVLDINPSKMRKKQNLNLNFKECVNGISISDSCGSTEK
jgi:hypothetical protein